MQLDGVHHIGLNVRDLDRAEAFYTEVLGMAVTERYAESIRHIMLRASGEPEQTAKIHLFETKDLDLTDALDTLSRQGYAHIAFGTTHDQFPSIVEELKKRKVEFRGPLVMGKGESVHFTDPDGFPGAITPQIHALPLAGGISGPDPYGLPATRPLIKPSIDSFISH